MVNREDNAERDDFEVRSGRFEVRLSVRMEEDDEGKKAGGGGFSAIF
jgi:hypothetical protein